MEPIAETKIDLFASVLPSLDELKILSNQVNSSSLSKSAFNELIQENISKTSPEISLAVGIGLFILGQNNEAITKLEKAADCKEKFLYLANSLRMVNQFDKAIDNLQKSISAGVDSLTAALEKADIYRQALRFEDCEKELKNCESIANTSAEYRYQLARFKETQGLYRDATENYKKAIELEPDNQKILFHMAYRCDMDGDEDAAIDYYKQIISTSPAYVSALINLSVLYDDMGQFNKAEKCIDKVLEFHPNHQRAIMFKKDIESSMTMFYDEEREKKKDRKNQILETPISDFELSVRSRNCLRKMNIHTLGDLLNITESELLSYKNFGETSLKEIKVILNSKSLHLGIALEDSQFSQNFHIPEPGENEDDALTGKPLDDLRLSIRARKCLQKLNIATIGELTRRTEAELLGCKNFGVTSLNEIKKAISKFGLSLRTLE